MVRDASQHAEEDKKRREEIEIRNTADARVYSIEKLLEENRDKVSPEDDRAVRAAVEEVKKALTDGTKEGIEAALKELERASHRLAENLYKTTGAPPTGEAPPGSGGPEPGGGPQKPPEGEVIDAEYVDVDEAKR
jgi:molecular chaperone DnaK